MPRTGHPRCALGREALRAGDSASSGEWLGSDRFGRNGVSAAKPAPVAGAGPIGMGGGRGGASTQELPAGGAGPSAGARDDPCLAGIFVEPEQAPGTAGEGKAGEGEAGQGEVKAREGEVSMSMASSPPPPG